MATISHMNSGKWQAKIRRKGLNTSKVFSTKARAERWARQLESEHDKYAGDSDLIRAKIAADKMTLADAADRYGREISSLKASHASEQSRWRVILATPLAGQPISKITPANIKDFFDEELIGNRDLSASSIQKYHALISHTFTVAIKRWGMSTLTNPMPAVEKPAIDNARARRFVGDEKDRLLAACAQPWRNKNPYLLPCVLFALETTQRVGEILALSWDDVDILGRKIQSKNKDTTGRNRNNIKYIPLSTRAIAVLDGLKKLHGYDAGGQVFQTTHEAIHAAFVRACARACEHVYDYVPGRKKGCDCIGIEDFHFHDLRHEAISSLFERTDLRTEQIMTMTGHKTYAMLQRYLHLRDTDSIADALG